MLPTRWGSNPQLLIISRTPIQLSQRGRPNICLKYSGILYFTIIVLNFEQIHLKTFLKNCSISFKQCRTWSDATFTVCSGLSVWTFRVNTIISVFLFVFFFVFFLQYCCFLCRWMVHGAHLDQIWVYTAKVNSVRHSAHNFLKEIYILSGEVTLSKWFYCYSEKGSFLKERIYSHGEQILSFLERTL